VCTPVAFFASKCSLGQMPALPRRESIGRLFGGVEDLPVQPLGPCSGSGWRAPAAAETAADVQASGSSLCSRGGCSGSPAMAACRLRKGRPPRSAAARHGQPPECDAAHPAGVAKPLRIPAVPGKASCALSGRRSNSMLQTGVSANFAASSGVPKEAYRSHRLRCSSAFVRHRKSSSGRYDVARD
jgi:hypothetical protein